MAYAGEVPVGWCSVGPREGFPVLNRSRILKKIDETPVWSVVCFFIEKIYRNKGISTQLLRAAMEYVEHQGGVVLEGYPVEPKKRKMPAAFAWTGLASSFKKAGFVVVARRSETRPMMRFSMSKG